MKITSNKFRRLGLLIILVICLISLSLFINENEKKVKENSKTYVSSDFKILDYNIILNVDKTNKVDVNEHLLVNIPNMNLNGIYKNIPLWQEYYDINNNLQKRKINVSNISVVGEKHTLYQQKEVVGLKIGSTRTTTEGDKNYHIKYRYNMGLDDNKGYDNFSFKVFDNYDNTKIDKLTIKINMPKKFDIKDIKFLKGNDDITKLVNYTVSDNSININIDNYQIDNSFTVNMTLPDGYFIGSTSNYSYVSLVTYIMVILCSIISALTYIKFGKRLNKRSVSIEFYAPDDLDAAEIGYIYGETSMQKLTAALIIQLASKKLLTIVESSNNQCKITKTDKEVSTNLLSINEDILYTELFRNSNEIIITNNGKLNTIFNKLSISLKNTTDKKINDLKSREMMDKIFIVLFIVTISWFISYLYINDLNPKLNILTNISFIAIFITGFFTLFMNRKTSYGENIYAQVLGFKRYLDTAEKDQLNNLISTNKDYFYDILPFAYVLNVSNNWIKSFDKNNLSTLDLSYIDYKIDDVFMVIN